jgi:hypothetical protein
MTKEQLIELLNGNLWVSGNPANSQTVMGIERAAEKIATKFFLMETEIERLRQVNSYMGWQLNPDRMGGQFTEEEKNRTGWL